MSDSEQVGDLWQGLDHRDLLEFAPDVVYLLDLEGRFRYINRVGLRHLGYEGDSDAPVIGRPFTEVLTAESADFAWRHFERGLEGEQRSPFFEVEARRADGVIVRLEVHASNHYREGRLVAIQGVGRDITEVERYQSEVAGRSERLAVMEERARIAHELYNRIAQITVGAGSVDESQELFAQVNRVIARGTAQKLGLSDVDLTIVRRVAAGATNRNIASEVHLSAHTVKDHLSRLMQQLKVGNRTELAVRAAKLGLV